SSKRGPRAATGATSAVVGAMSASPPAVEQAPSAASHISAAKRRIATPGPAQPAVGRSFRPAILRCRPAGAQHPAGAWLTSSPIMVDFRLTALDTTSDLRKQWRQNRGGFGGGRRMRTVLRVSKWLGGLAVLSLAALLTWLYLAPPDLIRVGSGYA